MGSKKPCHCSQAPAPRGQALCRCVTIVATMTLATTPFTASDISRIIEMAWEDRTEFEAIALQFGLNESGVVDLMRREMKPSSFRMWRKRMAGRATKHARLRLPSRLPEDA